MEITIERTITKKVKLHTQKADVVAKAIEDLFDDMCEHNHDEYCKMLIKVSAYVKDCADGWGIKNK